jgi:hypothetical protein
MSAELDRRIRRDLRRAAGEGVIATLDAQAAAIAKLSDDAREAFAEYKAKILSLEARIQELENQHYEEPGALRVG